MTKRLLLETGIGDVSDPDVYASGVVWSWENSDAGQWAKKHAKQGKIWYTNEFDPEGAEAYSVVFRIRVYCEMSDKDYTYYSLKFGATT